MAGKETDGKAYVYIMTNQGIPDYVKIGYATDLERRRKELSKSSSSPFSFKIYAYYEINEKDRSELDRDTKETKEDLIIHKLIDTINPDLRAIDKDEHTKREFFKISPETAYEILESMAAFAHTSDSLHRVGPNGKINKVQAEKEEQSNEEKTEKGRRGPFSFAECGIEPGSIIILKDNPEITAKVIDDKRVECNGVVGTTSQLARDILGKNHNVQGPVYWIYNGKLLDDIRKEKNK